MLVSIFPEKIEIFVFLGVVFGICVSLKDVLTKLMWKDLLMEKFSERVFAINEKETLLEQLYEMNLERLRNKSID